MKVKELIDILSVLNPEAVVYVKADLDEDDIISVEEENGKIIIY